MSWMKRLADFFRGGRSTSTSVKSIEEIFDDNSEGQLFFDLVVARFNHYDELNNHHSNECFATDIEFISQCLIASLSAPEYQKLFQTRIDAYFYMYCRLKEYIHLAERFEGQIEDVRRQLYEQLRLTFKSTNGQQPNLCIKDKDSVQRMGIQQHLSWIKAIDNVDRLHLFFVLCKLSFQSSFIVNDHDHLQWIDILSEIDHCKLSVGTIISEYVNYKQAFEPFPLDIPAFVHLIRKIYQSKSNQQSPFEDFINMINQLGFDHKAFFQQFHSVFIDNLNKTYDFIHITGLLQLLSKQDEGLFAKYLSAYSSNINNDILWKMLLVFIKNGDINEIIQKHFGLILRHRLQAISIENFQGYYGSINEYLKLDKAEIRPFFLKLFEQIFQAFLHKQLTDDQYSYRIYENHLKSFLNIAQELSPVVDFQQSSYSLVIQHLLFKLHKSVPDKHRKIRYLFCRIDRLSSEKWFQNHDPSSIIREDWLNDHLLNIPEQWLKMNEHEYQTLCDAYRSNSWSIHIWSRIIYLSVRKSDSLNPNEILPPLNQWLVDVKHDTYDANDKLTAIFVKNIFELIIAKHMKFITSLSNIDVIIQYALHLRQQAPDFIDTKLVDDFVENIKQSIKEILLLNGKIND